MKIRPEAPDGPIHFDVRNGFIYFKQDLNMWQHQGDMDQRGVCLGPWVEFKNWTMI